MDFCWYSMFLMVLVNTANSRTEMRLNLFWISKRKISHERFLDSSTSIPKYTHKPALLSTSLDQRILPWLMDLFWNRYTSIFALLYLLINLVGLLISFSGKQFFILRSSFLYIFSTQVLNSVYVPLSNGSTEVTTV